MNKETLNKLKELAQKAIDNGPGNWPFHSAAFKAHITPAAVLELIAIAECSSAPVSQMTDEQEWREWYGKGFQEGVAYANRDSSMKLDLNEQALNDIDQVDGCMCITQVEPEDNAAWLRIRAILAAAEPQAQAPAASMAEPVQSALPEGWKTRARHDDALANATQPQPVPEQGELPEDDDELAQWAENHGVQVAWANDDDMHHIIKVTPPELRMLIAASQQAAEPVAQVIEKDGDSYITWAIEDTDNYPSGTWLYAATPPAPAVSQPQAAKSTKLRELRDKWKIVDGDMRERGNGRITYHLDAFMEGLNFSRDYCSGDPTSCPDNEGYGCACDPMNKASTTTPANCQDGEGEKA